MSSSTGTRHARSSSCASRPTTTDRRRCPALAVDRRQQFEVLADRVLVYTDDGEADAERLDATACSPESVLVRRSTLEDVFLTLTGRTLEE